MCITLCVNIIDILRCCVHVSHCLICFCLRRINHMAINHLHSSSEVLHRHIWQRYTCMWPVTEKLSSSCFGLKFCPIFLLIFFCTFKWKSSWWIYLAYVATFYDWSEWQILKKSRLISSIRECSMAKFFSLYNIGLTLL